MALRRWAALRSGAMSRSVLAAAIGALVLGGCGDSETEDRPTARGGTAKVADPGPVHVHGLGVNPRDGALFIATHTGLFRSARGEQASRRIAGRYQDTMGFTVVGPDEFLGSGHPDGRENLPPFLGLIRSTDAGRNWKPVSLLGKVDFHVLEARRDAVYGYGSDMETRQARFLRSANGGRTWSPLGAPEPLVSLAINPDRGSELIASGERGVYQSDDSGRRWTRIEGPAGLVAWTSAGWLVVDATGSVWKGARDREWTRLGETGGPPAALEAATDEALYVALHDGTIKRSDDGGRNWRVRARP